MLSVRKAAKLRDGGFSSASEGIDLYTWFPMNATLQEL
jgi:hypothetical protein